VGSIIQFLFQVIVLFEPAYPSLHVYDDFSVILRLWSSGLICNPEDGRSVFLCNVGIAHKTTRCHNPQALNLNNHRRGNHGSHIELCCGVHDSAPSSVHNTIQRRMVGWLLMVCKIVREDVVVAYFNVYCESCLHKVHKIIT
jgi:hypothetical protein